MRALAYPFFTLILLALGCTQPIRTTPSQPRGRHPAATLDILKQELTDEQERLESLKTGIASLQSDIDQARSTQRRFLEQQERVGSPPLVSLDCPRCGVVYGLSRQYRDRRRKDHAKWRCPNNHPVWFAP